MWKCADCRKRSIEVCYSITFVCHLCDECYIDRCDARLEEREQAAIDACYSNGEQDA